MKILAKYLGGSYSYGLNTPESDKDERFCFLNTDISSIIGLGRHDHQSSHVEGAEDIFGFEIRHFLNLLRKGNTQTIEFLYNDTWLEITSEFKLIQSYKDKLVDSHRVYKCLKGYCYSERRFALGERTGKLGGKRIEIIVNQGYSHKNTSHFMRLALAGSIFFQWGYFPVNIRKEDVSGLIYDVKTNPQNYNKDSAARLMDEFEKKLDDSYNNIQVVHKYDVDLANQLCFDLYMPVLDKIKLRQGIC